MLDAISFDTSIFRIVVFFSFFSKNLYIMNFYIRIVNRLEREEFKIFSHFSRSKINQLINF